MENTGTIQEGTWSVEDPGMPGPSYDVMIGIFDTYSWTYFGLNVNTRIPFQIALFNEHITVYSVDRAGLPRISCNLPKR